MRKNTSFAIAATMLGLAMIFSKSSVDQCRHGPAKGWIVGVVISGSYLPFQAVEPIW